MSIDSSPEIGLQEPWAGYREMSVPDVLALIETAGETRLAHIHMFETTHDNRRVILDAVERRALRRAS